jgi:2',3'-cyclic-nucleotide 2'-phosphodiesterase (5'-nucleotidase family)
MNAVGYDYAGLGNHEFDTGLDSIRDFRDIADFELLSANIYADGSLVADSPTALIDVDGVKVGIIGITTPDYLCPGLDVLTSEEVVAKYAPKLEAKADLIIALTHLGLKRDKDLAAATNQIDVIVGGHSHTKLDKPIKINNTLIVHAGTWGWYLGRLDIKINLDTEEILESKSRLIAMPHETLPPDPETKRVIDQWQGKIEKQVKVKIGYNPSHLSMPQLRKRIARIWQQAYQTDFAHQTSGGTRYPLPQGDILISNIYDIMPFNRDLVILELNREQIKTVFENPEFNQDKDFYTCITNDHIANKLIEQFNVPAKRVERIAVSWREPIIKYIKANGKM